MIYASFRLPRVRFCEVRMVTLSPFSDRMSSTFEWLSARCVVVMTCSMNVHSDSVLFVALKSRTRWMAEAEPSRVMKYSRRRNSSDMEKEVCHTSERPTCFSTHYRISAICLVFVNADCVLVDESR